MFATSFCGRLFEISEYDCEWPCSTSRYFFVNLTIWTSSQEELWVFEEVETTSTILSGDQTMQEQLFIPIKGCGEKKEICFLGP